VEETLAEHSARLRALLHTAPSREGWEAIVASLKDWPEARGRAAALKRVATHLARWPATVCQANLTYNLYFGSKLSHPFPVLIRSVDWDVDSDCFQAQSIPQVLGAFPHLESVIIRITDTDCSVKWLKHLRDECVQACDTAIAQSASLVECETWVVGYHIGPEEHRESLADRWQRGSGWESLYDSWETIAARHDT
jgi:hypothetical protein